MTEGKKITSLEELDKKMAEQRKRMREAHKAAPPQGHSPAQPMQGPFGDAMERAFRENINKGIKCGACNWLNHGQKLVIMQTMEVMKEILPIPTIMCGQCGSLFVPKWARRVVRQAIEQENKIIKQVQATAEAGLGD